MPLMDEIQKFHYPFNDPNELAGLKKEEQVEVSFQCRYCDVTFVWDVPAQTKIKYWRCPACKQRNAMYV